MKRYELSLKAGYLPNWDLWSGIRELVQNARDAELQDGAKMTVEHCHRQRAKTAVGTLIICNEGTTIPLEAFLIGHTSKYGRSDLMGKYGEGLKFGILALLRLGLDIKIRNGDQTWNPVIVQSKDYDAEVLAFDVASGNRFENRVQIEVVGITSEEWEKIQKRFLFINQPHPISVIKVSGGKILMSPEHQGSLFIKGMFVCKSDSLFYGYDVDDADIDRDRRMVSNISAVTGRLLSAAITAGKLTDKVYSLLHDGSPEVSSIYGYTLSEDAQAAIVDAFHKQYGKTSIAVESDDQITELGHLGVRGVRLPYNLQNILSTRLGSAKTNIAKLKMNARHIFQRSDLTEYELDNLNQAQELLRTALATNNFAVDLTERLYIVEFSDPKLYGTYTSDERTIRLARHRLQKVSHILCTLIHEAAHQAGPDGSKQHEMAISNLTETVFSLLLEEESN